MLKRISTLTLCAGLALGAWAAPARPGIHLFTQPDGTQIRVMLVGDESFHYFQTLDGVPLARRADGALCYALCEGGVLKASTQLAHNADLRTADELSFIDSNVSATSVNALATARRVARGQQRAAARAAAGPADAPVTRSTTGKHKGLVILVNFKDKKFNANNTRDKFDDLMNKEGYTDNGNSMSVSDYFYAQSYGQLDVTFDVVGPVTVSKNMASYGGNDTWGNDKDPAGMVYEACKLVDSQVNFADYDWDGDGEVDQVYLIYAGYSEAAGADDDTIWPHEWTLQAGGKYLTLDGVVINTYGCSSELIGTSGTRMDGVGTPCHEFSHCLGLPDVYDTQYVNYGMAQWSVMDMGCYADDGFGPVGYTAYERWFSGWMEPTVLDKGQSITGMKALTDSPEAYVIYNDAYPNEYYLLENRQKKASDKYAPGHGLLVTHLLYDATAWRNNTVNVGTPYYTVIPADNSLQSSSYDMGRDAYPSTKKNTELTDTSTPAAKLYKNNTSGRKYMSKPITNIAESDGLIAFDFMGGAPTGINEVTTSQPTPLTLVTVYSLDGRELRQTTYGQWSNQLDPGVYVLRLPDGTSIKAASRR